MYLIKNYILKLAKRQVTKIEAGNLGFLADEDADYCRLFHRCNDWHDDEDFGKLAKQTLIHSLSSKRKN